MNLQQAFELAISHHQAGRLPEAEALYRQILAQQPNEPQTLHMLGLLAHHIGKHEIAIQLIEKSIQIDPQSAASRSNLGLALLALNRVDDAIATFRASLQLDPNLPETHNNLGNALHRKGDLSGADQSYLAAIRIRPQFAAAHVNHGNIQQQLGKLDEAAAAFEQALQLNPRSVEAWTNLGNTHQQRGDLPKAIATYTAAAQANPSSAVPHFNLATALEQAGQMSRAIESFNRAIQIDPRFIQAYHVGALLQDIGQIDQAIACFREAVRVNPYAVLPHSNLCHSLHFHPDFSARAIFEEHRRWNANFAAPLKPKTQTQHVASDPSRRLRVGYVSPNFHMHPVARFLLPLLEQHDHTRFEIHCFSDAAHPDEYTHRIRACADVWHDTGKLTDEQLAALIREKQIDLLIDLSAHMAGHRLLCFARKPAPVQISYLAYCSTTGLDAMDFRISDPHLDPPGADESVYSERTLRLPRSYWCYEAPTEAPAPGDLPADVNRGAITFGCLNNFGKVATLAIQTWIRILRNVPDSRLILHTRAGDHREHILDRFAAQGIERNRIHFAGMQPFADYLATYQQIDIALDTFPYAGGTTSCDALWMGVPIITLRGQTAVGRGGVSILSNLGLAELIAENQEQYITLACDLASDLPRLRALRASLRQRMDASPLLDAPAFARDMETLFLEALRVAGTNG